MSCRAERAGPRPALILDGDGVLVKRLAISLARRMSRSGGAPSNCCNGLVSVAFAIAVATNQSGISRGMFGWKDYAAVEAEIDRQLAARGLSLDIVIACAFHPDYTAGRRRLPG